MLATDRHAVLEQARDSGMRFPDLRVRGTVMALLVIFLTAAGSHAQAAKLATIVMDMRDGAVYHADGADRQQHPASLTKMMTLYLTFEAVRDGRISLDQKFRVSRHAAQQPASKLYLNTGQQVTVRHLIRATALKSANDAAMVLAEGIGGSQAAFADMMTRRAHQLGMRNTTFKNPHGLTASGHLSTARDMAVLARHLFHDFPEYYNIFSRTNDHAAGKRIWTTNRLLSSYRGADGIKTGYTSAAGYNLAASAHRGNQRILAVAMGSPSSAARNKKVAELLDLGFAKAPGSVQIVKPSISTPVLVASAPLPTAKPGEPATGLNALAEALVPTANAATPPAASASAATPASHSPHAPQNIADLPQPRAVMNAMVRTALGGPNKGGIPMPPRRPGSSADMAWSAEIGPYTSETAALATLADITAREIATGSDIAINENHLLGGEPGYSLHLAGMSEGSAAELCSVITASQMGCSVVLAAN